MNVFPPIEHDAVTWLQNYIKPSMIAFEYGSGDSTIYFNKFVKSLVSIEHIAEKFYVLKDKIHKSNFNYELIPPIKDPKPFPYSHLSYGSTDSDYLHYSFKNYVNHINNYPDRLFDIVLINGRSRASCIMTTIPKIKRGGILILNDSERYVYQDAQKLFLKTQTVVCFAGSNRKTSIYEIK